MPAGLLFDDTGYERASILPYRQNTATGAFEWAVPGLLASPFQAWQRAVAAANAGQRIDPADALDAAGGAMTGGLLATAPAGALASGMARRAPSDPRVSTRFPTAVKRTEDPIATQLSIGGPEVLASPTFDKNYTLLSEYPGFGRLAGMGKKEAAEAYIQQAADNMKWLYDVSGREMQERSPLWYDGANELNSIFADRFKIPKTSMAAAIANLSPQKDWFQNVSLAERLGDIVTGTASSRLFSNEMADKFFSIDSLNKPKYMPLFEEVRGKSFNQLAGNPLGQALWARVYDETYNPRNFRSISPEGLLGDYVAGQAGDNKVGWGSLTEISKALQSLLSDGDPSTLSPLLGERHKVRNFYNNIILPMDRRFGDVTADTHQVAAAQLRPLSGDSPAVAHNFGNSLDKKKQPPGWQAASNSSIDGVQGTYGLVAEATRRAAKDLGLLPRQVQSATWEPVRELFPDTFKTATNARLIDDIWRSFDAREIGIDEARRRVLDAAGGFGRPAWAEPGVSFLPATGRSTYR